MTFPAAAGAYAADKGLQAGRSAARAADRARLPTGDRAYQGAILAEFVIAVIVVSTGPLVNPPQDGKGGPSPYRVNHMRQLVGIGIVYFILALLSSGRHGRVAAWFGGLVLLGLGFTQLANGDLTAFFHVFDPTSTGSQDLQQAAAQFATEAQGAATAAEQVGAQAAGQPVGYQGTAPGPYTVTSTGTSPQPAATQVAPGVFTQGGPG